MGVPFDRRLATNFDWGTLTLSLAIITLSIVLLYSATSDRTEGPSGMHLKQLMWTGMGLVGMFAVLCVDYQTLCRHAYVLYGALLVSLVIVLQFGRVVNGSQRWRVLGPWHVQTSELAKPVLILVLARYFTEHTAAGTASLTFRGLLCPVLLVGLPFVLIVKQPNLSTAMVLVVLLGVMALMIGLRRTTLITLLLLGVGVVPLAWTLVLGIVVDRAELLVAAIPLACALLAAGAPAAAPRFTLRPRLRILFLPCWQKKLVLSGSYCYCVSLAVCSCMVLALPIGRAIA